MSTKSGFKRTLKPRCLLLKPRRVGSIGPGGQSRPRSGVIVRRGRMGLCRRRLIRLLSSVGILCLISGVWGCRSIIEVIVFHVYDIRDEISLGFVFLFGFVILHLHWSVCISLCMLLISQF